MAKLMSLRAYARHRRRHGLPGGNLSAVQKAIKTCRISAIGGKIDAEVADIQWDRNTDAAQQQRGGAQASPAARADDEEKSPGPSEGQLNRLREAARADAARADLLEYELGIKRGGLLPVEDVRKAAFEKARMARDQLMSIPDRLGPLIAAETDPAKVHEMLTRELRRVCEELASTEKVTTRH